MRRIVDRGLAKLGARSTQSLGVLFSPGFYRASNPDLVLSDADAEQHYLTVGWREGRAPNPLFDVRGYLARYPDIADAGIEPLQHYRTRGWKEMRDPSAWFSTAWYLSNNKDVAKSRVCPLEHYFRDGWREGRPVVAWFNADWYRSQAQSSLPANTDPLGHYLLIGWRSSFGPNPLFSPRFYLQDNPDIAESGLEPIGHYLSAGSAEGRRPHPLFDPVAYRRRNPDVVTAGLEPMLHYLGAGEREGRDATVLFDAKLYRRENPDVAGNGVSALAHYLGSGWREGRRPNDWFDARHYLSLVPPLDPAEIGDPLSHFAAVGWKQGRQPLPGYDSERLIAELAQGGRFEEHVGRFMTGGPRIAQPSADGVLDVSPRELELGAAEAVAPEIERAPEPEPEPERVFDYGVAFDASYYFASNPELDLGSLTPQQHYRTHGIAEGLDPNPLFHTRWYLTRYPDVAASGQDPLEHYLTTGWREGRDPSTLFQTDWYLLHNPDVPADTCPLLHYLGGGWRAGARAAVWFDPQWYAASNSQKFLFTGDPLAHYLTIGWKLGLEPNHLFRPAFYFAGNPDVLEAGIEPVRHYLEGGCAQGRRPHPLFDPISYRERNSATLPAGASPFLDALEVGPREGRLVTTLFDPDFYRSQIRDASLLLADPLRHYLSQGGQTELAPNDWFDPQYYMSQQPALESGMRQDLLSHFVTVGWYELRAPSPLFDSEGLRDAMVQALAQPHLPLRFDSLVAEYLVKPPTSTPAEIEIIENIPDSPVDDLPGPVQYDHAEDTPDAAEEDTVSDAQCLSDQPGDIPLEESGEPDVDVEMRSRRARLQAVTDFLFDAKWYASQLPAAERKNPDLQAHFLDAGLQAGLSPNPLFDPAWYVATNTDVAELGLAGFEHFCLTGLAEGRVPCAAFDLDFYLSQAPEASEHEFGALGHYVSVGAGAGLSPSPLFDPEWYRQQSVQLAQYTGDLFAHYIVKGWRSGLSPHPCFDSGWYRRQLVESQLNQPDITHYLQHGYKKHFSPHPLFDEKWYVSTYLPGHDLPGLPHYLVHGWGYDLHPHPLFDAHFYKTNKPVLVRPALVDYLKSGEASGLRPSAVFSASQYKALNPDVVPSGMSAFAHFAAEGDSLHLSPSIEFRSKRYWSRYMSYSGETEPLRHYMFIGRHYGLAVPGEGRDFQRDPAAWLEARDSALSGLSGRSQPDQSARKKNSARTTAVVVVVGEAVRLRSRICEQHLAAASGKRFKVLTATSCTDLPATLRKSGVVDPDTPVVIVDRDCMMSRADCDALADALVTHPSQPALAFPLVLDRNLDVANCGIEVRDVLACPRPVGGDPDHPTLCVARPGLLADSPAFAFRFGDLETVLDAATERDSVVGLAHLVSENLRLQGRQTLFTPNARVVSLNPVRFETQKLARKITGSASGQKMLFIDSLITMPDRDAGSYYALTLMRMYQSWGYEVTFCPDADYRPEERYVRALEWEGITVLRSPFVNSTADFLKATRDVFDVVVMSRVHSGGAYLERLREKWPKATLVFHPGDLHYLRESREAVMTDDVAGFTQSIATRKRELHVIKHADLTVLVSEFELHTLETLGLAAKAVVIAPEYQGSSAAKTVYEPKKRKSVAFVGGYRHMPNVDAARFLVEKVWPLVVAKRRNIRLELVGSDPPDTMRELESDTVKLVGFVPSISDYLETVRLTVAPVRYGAGIKMKLIASLEAGVPVVATSVAAEGIGIDNGYLVANEPKEIADAIITLFDDTERLKSMSTSGRQEILARYAPEAVRQHYRSVFDQVLARKAESAGSLPIAMPSADKPAATQPTKGKARSGKSRKSPGTSNSRPDPVRAAAGSRSRETATNPAKTNRRRSARRIAPSNRGEKGPS